MNTNTTIEDLVKIKTALEKELDRIRNRYTDEKTPLAEDCFYEGMDIAYCDAIKRINIALGIAD